MRLHLLAFAFLLALPCDSISSAAEARGGGPHLAKNGRLGIPLKTEATIEVEVVRAEDVGRNDLAGQYLLRVSKVNGAALTEKRVFKFRTGPGVPALPADVFELYKLKTGRNVDELPDEEVRLSERDHVGKKLTYLASEIVNPPTAGRPGNGGKAIESTLLLSRLIERP